MLKAPTMKKTFRYLAPLCCSLLGLTVSPLLAQPSWNSSFEEGMKDWEAPVIRPRAGQAPGNNEVGIVEGKMRDGNKALEIVADSWSPQISVRSKPQPLLENQPYQMIRGWARYEGAANRIFGMKIHLLDAQQQPIKDAVYSRNGSHIPVGEWFPVTNRFDVPANARYYVAELFWDVGNGKVAFDDLTLTAIPAPAATRTGYTLNGLSNASRTLWVANQLEKIYPDHTAPQATGDRVQLSAAKGESQSVQLVYQPHSAGPMPGVVIEPLKSSATGATLGADIIDVRYVGDVEVKKNVQQFGRGGPTPDLLLTQPPTALAANKPQSIWLTAQVPRNAAAGRYQSQVRLQTAQGEIRVPLQLDVFNFALPEKPALKTDAHAPQIVAEARQALRARLLANRVTSEIGYGGGVQSLGVQLNPDYTVTIDFAAWDAIMEKYFAAGMESFLVPTVLFGDISGLYNKGEWRYAKPPEGQPYVKYGTPEWEKAVTSYVGQMYAHLQEKGWQKYAHWEIWDEPMGTTMRGQLKHIAALVRKNAPEAKIAVTGWPIENGETNIDLWIPQVSLYEPRLREISDKEFGVYHNGLFIIDLPYGLTSMRHQAWWMWQNDITMLLWWGVTYGWGTDVYNDLAPYPGQNGQGFLFYPGQDGDKSKVIDSLRIAAWRAAVNDYDYFTLLAKGQDEAAQKQGLSGRVPDGKAMVKTLVAAGLDKNDPNLLQEIRDLAARLIELQTQPPGIILEPAADYWTTGIISGRTAPGAKFIWQGKPVTADGNGRFQLKFH